MAPRFENSFECYAAIGRWLADVVPEPWHSIAVVSEITGIGALSTERVAYVPRKDPQLKTQLVIDDTTFADCFFQLARLASTPEKGLYKKCLFTLSADGRYKADFEY